jgi:hypothetical protein
VTMSAVEFEFRAFIGCSLVVIAFRDEGFCPPAAKIKYDAKDRRDANPRLHRAALVKLKLS